MANQAIKIQPAYVKVTRRESAKGEFWTVGVKDVHNEWYNGAFGKKEDVEFIKNCADNDQEMDIIQFTNKSGYQDFKLAKSAQNPQGNSPGSAESLSDRVQRLEKAMKALLLEMDKSVAEAVRMAVARHPGPQPPPVEPEPAPEPVNSLGAEPEEFEDDLPF